MDGIEAELDREELIALVVDHLEMIDKLRKVNAACRRTRRQAFHAAGWANHIRFVPRRVALRML